MIRAILGSLTGYLKMRLRRAGTGATGSIAPYGVV